MGESAGKHRKRCVDRLSGESKTCLVHVTGHSDDECKVLGDFGTNYAKGKPNRDCGNHPVPGKVLTGSRKIMPLLIMWWMKSYLKKYKN